MKQTDKSRLGTEANTVLLNDQLCLWTVLFPNGLDSVILLKDISFYPNG